MELLKKISLGPKSLRYKLMTAFCLMAIIPLLVAAYLVRDYIFPPSKESIIISLALFFAFVIAILGLMVARRMIDPMIEMAAEAKRIAKGDLRHKVSISAEDEIGDIGQSINQITRRIKEKMDELASYGEKTKLINTTIHKRVLALSSLLQISENISVSRQIKDTMSLVVDKIVEILDSGYAMLFLPTFDDADTLELKFANNVTSEKLRQIVIRRGRGTLGAALASGSSLYSDCKTKPIRDFVEFKEYYGITNFAIFPIISHNKPVGILLFGNEQKDFVFEEDDLELIKIFIKQAAIAYEHEELIRMAKELAVKDDLTDLYNKKYIKTRLEEEIKRALLCQRPCSYIVLNVDDFRKFREIHGELAAEKALKRIAVVIGETIPQIGRAARLGGNEFALLLPEKNKKEAHLIAEEVRKKVERLDLGLDKKMHLTISGGVSENPIDGSTADELMKKANESVSMAKSQGKNKITYS
jgi:diguanylate cyclase (GGDEF)-like protein